MALKLKSLYVPVWLFITTKDTTCSLNTSSNYVEARLKIRESEHEFFCIVRFESSALMWWNPHMTPALVGSRKRTRVIYISCETLFHNRAKLNMFKLNVLAVAKWYGQHHKILLHYSYLDTFTFAGSVEWNFLYSDWCSSWRLFDTNGSNLPFLNLYIQRVNLIQTCSFFIILIQNMHFQKNLHKHF